MYTQAGSRWWRLLRPKFSLLAISARALSVICLLAPSMFCPPNCYGKDPEVIEKVSGKKHYIVGSVEVRAARDLVWKALTDYDGAPYLFENLQECSVLKDYGSSKLVRQIVKTGILQMNLEYQVLSSELDNRIEFKSVSGKLQKFDGYWTIEPRGEAFTRVSYGLNLRGTSIIPTSLLRKSFKGYTPKLLASLRDRLEERAASQYRRSSSVELKRRLLE